MTRTGSPAPRQGRLGWSRPATPTTHAVGRLTPRARERLSASAAAELLDRRAPELHPILRARILAEAAGNPLALVELERSLPQWAIRERLAPTKRTQTASLHE